MLAWPLPLAARLTGAAALLAHAGFGGPAPPARLVCSADGRWSVPALGLSGLAVGRGSVARERWARIVLEGDGTRYATLVLYDQLPSAEWSRLRAVLDASSRPNAGEAGA